MSQSNYFTILLRQKANLVSLTEANRVVGAVPLALDGVLNDNHLKQILSLLPSTAVVSSKSTYKFYHRLSHDRATKEFNMAILLARLKTILNLTGQDEAANYLRAYFLSAWTLMDKSDVLRMKSMLPPELVYRLHD